MSPRVLGTLAFARSLSALAPLWFSALQKAASGQEAVRGGGQRAGPLPLKADSQESSHSTATLYSVDLNLVIGCKEN